MSEGTKIALTVLTGVAVFVLGQIIQRLFVEPIQQQRATIGKIVHAITYLRNVSAGHEGLIITEDPMTVHRTIRGLAADLRVSKRVIPLYNFTAFLGLALPKSVVNECCSCLIGWSNMLHKDEGQAKYKNIERLEDLLDAQLD